MHGLGGVSRGGVSYPQEIAYVRFIGQVEMPSIA
jgi:hypothetical protein